MEDLKLSQILNHIVAKSGQNGEQMWLPLWMHATDTAEVMEWLAENWISDSVWEILQNSGRYRRMTKKEVKKLVRFLGYIHDEGKISPYFSCLVTKNIPEALERLKEDGISIPPWKQYETSGCNHAYIGEVLLRFYGCPRGVASIIGSHHGMTQKISEYREDIEEILCERGKLGRNLYGDEALQWKRLRKEFLEWALQKSGYNDISEIPKLLQKGQILLTGLLIMADWIASNTKYFPLLALAEDGDETYYPRRIKDAMDNIKLPQPWESDTYFMDEEGFREIFGFLPRPAQIDFIQTIQDMTDTETQRPGIFILEAPMGIGKTEAALAGAQLLANRTAAGGIFFGLPTQATANSLFERVISWAEKQAENSPMGNSIRLAHGLAEFDPRYRMFLENDQIGDESEEELKENRLYAHTWFNGKKQAMLADFVVGTVDQILMSALKKKHVMLRHLGMASKIVIIDECHAYDVYTSEYLDRTLTWMGMYGQPVIVLSATLPAQRRRQLLAAYLNEKVDNIPKEIETAMGYPLLTYSAGETVLQKQLQSDSTQLVVNVESLDVDRLVDFLTESLKEGGCAAIILNTVRRVQKIAQLLKEELPDKEILELHSRYLYPDRKEREEELLKRMGKGSAAKERNGFILVASQVAEQSLDFDADILITELCPMDLLLQRMGREHRHREHDVIRPNNLSKARCMILRDGEEVYSKGSKAVYAEYLLMRTQKMLPGKISIPADIPMLVQKVYSDNNEEIFQNIEGYKEAKKKYQDAQKKKQSKASGFLLDKPKKREARRESCLDQWLTDSTSVDDKEAQAVVRDGSPSLEVLVLMEHDGRMSFVPWQDEDELLNGDELPSYEICMKIAKQRLRLPRLICREDRLGAVISELEKKFETYFSEWKKSPWINGELILLLDENLSATLGGVQIQYSRENGLMEIISQEERHGEKGV